MLKAKNIRVVGMTALIFAIVPVVQARNKARGLSPAWGKPQGLHTIKSPLSSNTLETLPVYDMNIIPQPPSQLPHPKGFDRTADVVVSNEEYRSAILKTSLSVFAAVLFGVALMATRGLSTGCEFFAGYLVEQSLSIDNLFVFIMLFDYFQVPLELQSWVLSWGIAGAIALRGLMIGVGVAAIQKFKSVILVFAGILLASSYKLLTETEGEGKDMDDNIIMRFTTSLFPNTSSDFDGDKFFVTNDMGKRMATPLFLCLVCVELSDFVFAVDSIPAVLGVSKDPLVVYASNIFAILALRSLYTLVAKAVTELHYLKPAVATVLGFVGIKMIAEYFHVEIGTGTSLGVVCSILGSGILASLWENNKSSVQMPSVSLPSWTNITLTT